MAFWTWVSYNYPALHVSWRSAFTRRFAWPPPHPAKFRVTVRSSAGSIGHAARSANERGVPLEGLIYAHPWFSSRVAAHGNIGPKNDPFPDELGSYQGHDVLLIYAEAPNQGFLLH